MAARSTPRPDSGERCRTVSVEVAMTHPIGVVEIETGRWDGNHLRLRSTTVNCTPSAKTVTGLHRDFEIDGDVLSLPPSNGDRRRTASCAPHRRASPGPLPAASPDRCSGSRCQTRSSVFSLARAPVRRARCRCVTRRPDPGLFGPDSVTWVGDARAEAPAGRRSRAPPAGGESTGRAGCDRAQHLQVRPIRTPRANGSLGHGRLLRHGQGGGADLGPRERAPPPRLGKPACGERDVEGRRRGLRYSASDPGAASLGPRLVRRHHAGGARRARRGPL